MSSDAKADLRCILQGKPNLVKAKLVLIDEEVDLGPAKDRNVGAVLADSPILLFADDDTVILEYITGLLNYLQEGKCCGIQPLLLRSAELEIVDSAGDFVRKGRPLFRPFIRGYRSSLKTLVGDLCVEEVPSMRSAFMLVKRDAFFAVGGFDSNFIFNYEDVDLGWRMTCVGFKQFFVPSVRA